MPGRFIPQHRQWDRCVLDLHDVLRRCRRSDLESVRPPNGHRHGDVAGGLGAAAGIDASRTYRSQNSIGPILRVQHLGVT